MAADRWRSAFKDCAGLCGYNFPLGREPDIPAVLEAVQRTCTSEQALQVRQAGMCRSVPCPRVRGCVGAGGLGHGGRQGGRGNFKIRGYLDTTVNQEGLVLFIITYCYQYCATASP